MAELDNAQTFGKVLAALEEQLRISGIHEAGRGLEFCILRAELPSGPIAIKVPRDRVFSNVNDAHIDSRILLDQEFTLMRYLQNAGFKEVPKPMRDLQAAGFGALVMSYVPSDDSAPNQYELGKLLARLHMLEPPRVELSAQEGCTIPQLLAQRMTRRWQELTRLETGLPELPHEAVIAQRLEHVSSHKSLLHMDFRHANFRMQKGSVVALVDWSNALVGPPALELARVAETGEANDMFWQGYASITPLPQIDRLSETLFRLDTAIMLALVFLSEEPNPERAAPAIKRVRALHQGLRKNLKTA